MFLDFKPLVLAALSLADGMGESRKNLASGARAGTSVGTGELPFVETGEIGTADLRRIAAPLRSVRIGAGKRTTQEGWMASNHGRSEYRKEIVLFRRRGDREVSALRTKEGGERAALESLRRREDVEFATLDKIQTRQFTPTDANLNFQWHHGVVDSFGAWENGLGNRTVAVAIVDTPFQMNHSDLIENTEAGWDVVDEMPILTSAGDSHSTATAGMAAAVINNGMGVAGAVNCRLVPIGITGATSEMYQAVLWAADHNIRVVNISWTGADEPVLEAAGQYLEERVQGVLVMPGLNETGQAGFVNHPHIVCVSMTDAADNARSLSGPHIDFAAPGWDVYTTTTNNMYAVARGTSFAAPFFSGVAAMVMSINPALTAAQVVEVLKTTADDRGNSGWDESFGWGRVNFRAATENTVTSLPRITRIRAYPGEIELSVETMYPSLLVLERRNLSADSAWVRVNEMNSTGSSTNFHDTAESGGAMYRVGAEVARE